MYNKFNLDEVAYKDLNNLKKVKSMKDVKRAAHSQGYELSEPRKGVGDHYDVDLTHRKSGNKVTPSRGGKLGGAKKSGDTVDTTLINQVAASIKNDAAARGRVDKTPAGKAKRAEPFGYKGKSLREFMDMCEQALAESPYL